METLRDKGLIKKAMGGAKIVGLVNNINMNIDRAKALDPDDAYKISRLIFNSVVDVMSIVQEASMESDSIEYIEMEQLNRNLKNNGELTEAVFEMIGEGINNNESPTNVALNTAMTLVVKGLGHKMNPVVRTIFEALV
jgi:hypothetical protein